MTNYTRYAAQRAAVAAASVTANMQRRAQKRVHQSAVLISRGARAEAGANICNAAVVKLIRALYERDEHLGGWAFVNPDYTITPTVPWGRRYKDWGLNSYQSKILTYHMMGLASITEPPPLLTFDDMIRQWVINIPDYPTRIDALKYWRKMELTAQRYAAIENTLRKQREAKRIKARKRAQAGRVNGEREAQ